MTGTRYHKVYSRLWMSPEFKAAGDDERLAWLYVLTNRHRNAEGLYTLPLPLAAHELGWSIERTTAALEALEEAHMVALDRSTDLLWIINAVAWNQPRGEKQIKGAVNVLAETPDSFLRSHYLLKCREVCPDLAKAIEGELRWSDTPSIPLRCPMGITIRISSSSSSSSSSSNSNSSDPASSRTEDPSGDQPELELVEVVELTDRLIEALGIVGAISNEGERRIVAKARARGWTETDLLDQAHIVAARDDVDRPRNYLAKVLTRMANSDPEAEATTTAGGETREQAWAAVARHAAAGVRNWGAVDELSPRARRAARDARQAIRYQSANEAKWAFFDAWAAATTEHEATA